MANFNDKLKSARLEKKLTQQQLAIELTQTGYKTSNTAIANWESGLNKPDIDTLNAICKILDKDGNYFFEIGNEKDILDDALIGMSRDSYDALTEAQKEQIRNFIRFVADDGKK